MLVLKDLQKKFGKQHVLQHITHTFDTGSKTVVLGSNGSGKSTLIKILSGALEATDAPPSANFTGREIPATELGQDCTIAAPYVALNPMFSLAETLAFHQDCCPSFPRSTPIFGWKSRAHTPLIQTPVNLQLRHAAARAPHARYWLGSTATTTR